MREVVSGAQEARGASRGAEPPYGLQGHRAELERQAGGRAAERLRYSYGAWPRLLSLFRLVYQSRAAVMEEYGPAPQGARRRRVAHRNDTNGQMLPAGTKTVAPCISVDIALTRNLPCRSGR